MEDEINLSAITLEDCVELYDKKGKTVVIENGNIVEII